MKNQYGSVQDGASVDAAEALKYYVTDPPPVARYDLSKTSDLRCGNRSIAIVTTAALPWMTGTAVNPILRAVYLARDKHKVALVIPWVRSQDSQRRIYGGKLFRSSEEQREFIVQWLSEQGFGDVKIQIVFYDGVYSERYGSVFPLKAVTDVFARMPNFKRDVCVLEEPEHLNWHHPGSPWPELFPIVVGIIHTNYVEYAKHDGPHGKPRAFLLMILNIWVARSYCHRIIKLSDAVQFFPNSVTCNVHGVRQRFLDIGIHSKNHESKGAYFLAKTLWTKGYANLLSLLKEHYKRTKTPLSMRFVGNGPDAQDVVKELRGDKAFRNVEFRPQVIDHASEELQSYRLYVNASVSEVVCTATAEALAMGKSVLIIKHSSNEFFESFPNCHVFTTAQEFSDLFESLMDKEPAPLTEKDLYRLSWKAATDRFYESTIMPDGQKQSEHVAQQALGSAHSALSKIYPNPGESMERQQDEEELDESMVGELG